MPITKEILHNVPAVSRLVLQAVAASSTPMTISHLSESTGSTPSTLERVSRKLVKRGLLVRVPSASSHIVGFALSEGVR